MIKKIGFLLSIILIAFQHIYNKIITALDADHVIVSSGINFQIMEDY